MELGDEEACRWLFQRFPRHEIRGVAQQSRRLTRKSAGFWAVYFGLPQSQVRSLAQEEWQWSPSECYDYPLLFPPRTSEGVTIAHPVDIGLMKISAISSRGAKRDFIDLFEIAHRFMALGDLFGLLPQKYGPKANRLHMLKSLVYFDDAERDPDPGGWDSTQWPMIKQFFVQSMSQIGLLENE